MKKTLESAFAGNRLISFDSMGFKFFHLTLSLGQEDGMIMNSAETVYTAVNTIEGIDKVVKPYNRVDFTGMVTKKLYEEIEVAFIKIEGESW